MLVTINQPVNQNNAMHTKQHMLCNQSCADSIRLLTSWCTAKCKNGEACEILSRPAKPPDILGSRPRLLLAEPVANSMKVLLTGDPFPGFLLDVVKMAFHSWLRIASQPR